MCETEVGRSSSADSIQLLLEWALTWKCTGFLFIAGEKGCLGHCWLVLWSSWKAWGSRAPGQLLPCVSRCVWADVSAEGVVSLARASVSSSASLGWLLRIPFGVKVNCTSLWGPHPLCDLEEHFCVFPFNVGSAEQLVSFSLEDGKADFYIYMSWAHLEWWVSPRIPLELVF